MALADAGYTRTEIAAKLDLLYHRVAGVLKRGTHHHPALGELSGGDGRHAHLAA
jgi:hypothetical protein